MKKKTNNKYYLYLIFLLLIVFFAGCGGGGSGGGGTGSILVPNSQDQDYNYDDNNDYNNDNLSLYLVWDPPTTNADGTPLTDSDLAGYKVYFGTAPSSYTSYIDVGNTTTVALNSLGITSGTWCFAVTAYDTFGNESDYSDEVCTTI